MKFELLILTLKGFARFIEHLAVDYIFPEWDIWTQFVANVYDVALNLDSLKNTHAIEIPVKNPSEINEIFDSISYAKGGSCLRMLVDFIGLESFQKGLQEYLEKFKYGNTVTEDLWESLSSIAKKPVKEVMDTFIKQEGYPVVTVKETSVDEDLNVVLSFHQQRFFLSGLDSKDETLWNIPISIKTKSGERFDFIFKDKETTFTIQLKSKDEWIKLNDGQSGFYRVNYSSTLLEKLSNGILNLEIPPRDRISLISDYFNLSRAGVISITEFLNLLKSYKNENHYSIWSQISSCLGYLLNNLSSKSYYSKFQAMVSKIFEPLMESLGWDSKKGESDLDVLTRTIAISILAACDHQETIKEATKRFKENKTLSPDLRSLVYNLVVKNGGETEYDQMIQIYENAELNEEKNRALSALCKSKDSKLLKRTLELIMGDQVRAQDFITPLDSLSSNSFSRIAIWEFVKENWKLILKKFDGTGFLIPGVVNSTCSRFNTLEMAQDVTFFFQENPTPTAQRNILQCVERIGNNASFLKREDENLTKYFE
jgi:puromycin-sensitive aminopeptidase